jgi:hypothetical protein
VRNPFAYLAKKEKVFITFDNRRFDSLSELGTPTSLSSSSEITSPQFAAQIRPNNLGRRTSYRTYQVPMLKNCFLFVADVAQQ